MRNTAVPSSNHRPKVGNGLACFQKLSVKDAFTCVPACTQGGVDPGHPPQYRTCKLMGHTSAMSYTTFEVGTAAPPCTPRCSRAKGLAIYSWCNLSITMQPPASGSTCAPACTRGRVDPGHLPPTAHTAGPCVSASRAAGLGFWELGRQPAAGCMSGIPCRAGQTVAADTHMQALVGTVPVELDTGTY